MVEGGGSSANELYARISSVRKRHVRGRSLDTGHSPTLRKRRHGVARYVSLFVLGVFVAFTIAIVMIPETYRPHCSPGYQQEACFSALNSNSRRGLLSRLLQWFIVQRSIALSCRADGMTVCYPGIWTVGSRSTAPPGNAVCDNSLATRSFTRQVAEPDGSQLHNRDLWLRSELRRTHSLWIACVPEVLAHRDAFRGFIDLHLVAERIAPESSLFDPRCVNDCDGIVQPNDLQHWQKSPFLDGLDARVSLTTVSQVSSLDAIPVPWRSLNTLAWLLRYCCDCVRFHTLPSVIDSAITVQRTHSRIVVKVPVVNVHRGHVYLQRLLMPVIVRNASVVQSHSSRQIRLQYAESVSSTAEAEAAEPQRHWCDAGHALRAATVAVLSHDLVVEGSLDAPAWQSGALQMDQYLKWMRNEATKRDTLHAAIIQKPFTLTLHDVWLNNQGQAYDRDAVYRISVLTCGGDNVPVQAVSASDVVFVDTVYTLGLPRWGAEYYHWWVEALPRLALDVDWLIQHPNVLIHVSGHRCSGCVGPALPRFIMESMGLMGLLGDTIHLSSSSAGGHVDTKGHMKRPPRPRWVLEHRVITGSVRARTVHVPSLGACGRQHPLVIAAFRQHCEAVVRDTLSAFSFEVPRASEQERTLEHGLPWNRYCYLFHGNATWLDDSQPLVLVLQRRGDRRLLNLHDLLREVVAAIPQAAVVVLQEMPVPATAWLFSKAAVVIAPHGAGLSHVWFLSKQSLVVELVNADESINLCYAELCAWLPLRYVGVRAERDMSNDNRGALVLSVEQQQVVANMTRRFLTSELI